MPISLIEKRIAGLEEGDLESKIKIVGYDELATLSEKFNVMVDDIKNLLKQKIYNQKLVRARTVKKWQGTIHNSYNTMLKKYYVVTGIHRNQSGVFFLS